MFRIFWSDNPKDRKTHFIKEGDGPALGRYTKRVDLIDCYLSLNVYPDFNKEESYYDLGFDFDNGFDLRESARDARTLVAYLDDKLIPARIFFSGRKGFHVVVPYWASGLEPRADGGHVMKLLCQHITDLLKLPTLDNTIHGKKRMWRIPNTINSKSGLYKVEITREMLHETAEQGLEYIRPLASKPRPTTRPYFVEPNEQLVALIAPFVEQANAENKVREVRMKEKLSVTFDALPVCIKGILNDPKQVVRQAQTWQKQVPSRNNLTYIAATFFKSHRGYTEEEANDVLGESWQSKVATISASTPSQIARSTLTTVHAVYTGSDQFSCGYAISRGCNCWPGCPLYRKNNDGTGREKEANGTRQAPDGDTGRVDS